MATSTTTVATPTGNQSVAAINAARETAVAPGGSGQPYVGAGATNVSKGAGLGASPTVFTDANIRESTIPTTINKANTLLGPGNSVTDTGAPGSSTPATGATSGAGTYDSEASNFYDSVSGMLDQNNPETQSELALIQGMRDENNSSFNGALDTIHSQYNNRQAQLTANQSRGTAALRATLGASGALRYSPGTSQGILTAAENNNIQTLSDLDTQEQAAETAARTARDNQDYQLLDKNLGILSDLRDKKIALATDIGKSMLEENQKQRDTLNTQRQTVAEDAAKNGAPKSVIDAINASGDGTSAISAAGDYLQTATGQLGDYLQYKRTAESNGQTAEDYNTWKEADDAKTAKEKASEAYGTAFATAKGKADAEASVSGGNGPTSPVTAPTGAMSGITVNAPASVAPYVSFASNGVKYVDLSQFKGTPTEANQAVNDAQAAGYKVITNKQTANDVQNITDATAKLADMKTAFDSMTSGNVAERDLYAAAFTTMAKKLQTDPNVAASDTYQDTALDILKAMSGVQGFRGGASMVQQVKDTFPSITDTKAVADQKIANLQKLIGDRETALVGTPSASDQLLINAKKNDETVTQGLQTVKTSNPSLYNTASNMYTSLNPDTGQPYTPADILQAFPELNIKL